MPGWLVLVFALVSGGGPPPGLGDVCGPQGPAPGVSCRYECICFRTNGYRCLRTYSERCEGRECWQCQDRVTRKARLSCAIGEPVRSCFCKPYKTQEQGGAQSRNARRISAS